MASFLFYLAVVTLVLSVSISLELALGLRKILPLKDVPCAPGPALPLVSIIIPALNEEKTIEPALASVLAQDYANLEIIAVNDRSTDNTGAVLARLAQKHPKLRVMHVNELPAGWLGKNHALQLGAELASGDFYLFTDADVLLEKTTISRAINHVEQNRLDHLSLIFDVKGAGGLLHTIMLEFGGGLLWFLKPWQAKDPASKRFMGVGAFNLVRAAAYRQSGAHSAIALCPVDDIMLGKLLKKHGCRQELMSGAGLVAVKWYGTIREMMQGMTKNTFAGLDYSLARTLAVVTLQLLVGVWPLLSFFFTSGPTLFINGLIIAGRLLSFADGARRASVSPLNAFWSMVSGYFVIYMTLRAVLITLVRQGIDWRGTFYPLAELKANRM